MNDDRNDEFADGFDAIRPEPVRPAGRPECDHSGGHSGRGDDRVCDACGAVIHGAVLGPLKLPKGP
jgi:hypothetical protein